jgi:CO/xanthine dehydrogenase FAD-binding subunit/aerobic-type carbon monoxide dehydrogenase small subunit (CoxS/CutS family)
MLARGIRSYHRPSRLEDALSLAAQGAVPLAGGTRLLAAARPLPNVLDLSSLDLGGIASEDGDLVFGGMVTLQDVIESEAAWDATRGLLPEACLALSPSRMRRSMATLAGESVHDDPDSEVGAALLALNAVFVVAHPVEPKESPALRFLKNPANDLEGGGLVEKILIPGAPDGAALERAAVTPSSPPLVAVAVTVALSGSHCSRVRIALTGLKGRPARVLEAEGQVERTPAEDEAIARTAEQVATHAPFRDDEGATAGYRARVARVLTVRALERALRQARGRAARPHPRRRPVLPQRMPPALPYFTSGRIELSVNGRPVRAEVEAGTSLLELLRQKGLRGAKDGCEAGACGACTVILDGRPVNACVVLAVRAQGRSVQTVEGLGRPETPGSVPAAFARPLAFSCGYCTPGMEVATKALIDALPAPALEDARDALRGCLCPCTGHVAPTEAALRAAAGRKGRP